MLNIFKNYPKTKYYKKNEKGKDYVAWRIFKIRRKIKIN